MGKDLKGRNLGRGLSQRPDGRYMGRAQVNGKPIVLYDWKLKELKKSLAIAVDEAKRSNLMPDMDGKKKAKKMKSIISFITFVCGKSPPKTKNQA